MSFRIVRNDITKVSADAIVNSANPSPVYAGGTDAAVYKAAGEFELLEERKKIGDIAVGSAAVTPAFLLSAKYIIHTVGPDWVDGNHGEFEALRSCYENSLALASEYGCESIAFPLISTGVYGFPKNEALSIAVGSFESFLKDHDMEITLVVFDEESFVVSGKLFADINAYIDSKFAEDRLEEEYAVDDMCTDSFEAVDEEELEDPEPVGNRRKARRLFASKTMSSAAGSAKRESIKRGSAKRESVKREDFLGEAMCFASAMPSLDDRVLHVADTWQESLFRIIDEKGFTDTEVYKRANVDRKLFSKIRSNKNYQPKKITAVAFALALQLNLDETKDLLSRAGYALSPSSVFDLIIEYFIENEVHDIYTINLALFEHKQPILGE